MPTRRSARRPTRSDVREAPTEGLPIVAIVGRPNVGKSTLFNRIVGGRSAIVEDRARTTRDRLYAAAEWNDRRFIVVDTGGLERRPNDPIEAKVQDQARLAIGEADLILFVVDADSGETPADSEAADLLRPAAAPVLVAVNKADNERRELQGAEFHRLGWDETYPISALHGRGVADLLDAIVWALPPESASELVRKRREAEAEDALKWAEEGVLPVVLAEDGEGVVVATGPDRVAIVGRPNVGKSSLLNALLGEERVIVSETPGTTRDAIDTQMEWAGRPVRLIDTAGIRRRGKVASGAPTERFSALRAIKAIGRADVAILVLEAVDGLTAQDAHVAGYVLDEGVGLALAINKWDLIERHEKTFDEYVIALRAAAPFLHFAPVVAISARTGLRVSRALDAALTVAEERRRRVPTSELNRVLRDAAFRQAPPAVRGRRPRFFYATQAAAEPPTFVLFLSGAGSVHFSYERYLENRIRDTFGLRGTPIRLVFRERSRIDLEPRRRPRAANAGRQAARRSRTARVSR